MADFSKQWCEANDPEMPWDFDIIEEYNKLQEGYFIPMICEGYGFGAIAKVKGECLLLIDEEWKPYDIVIS